jgi:hypothetical protein
MHVSERVLSVQINVNLDKSETINLEWGSRTIYIFLSKYVAYSFISYILGIVNVDIFP